VDDKHTSNQNHIAIIGLSGRFPSARNVSEFWDNLVDGKQCSVDLSDEALRESGVPEYLINDGNFVKKGYIVDDIDLFDAGFFQFTPREAEITDPQHRMLLECCYEAIEHAGYSSDSYDGLIGMYTGVGPMLYYIRNLLPNAELLDSVGTLRMSIGNEKSFASTMVSYKLNLKGPSINIDTACSTSLVAVHQACQSLLAYECDVALAGGVCLDVPQKIGMHYKEGSIISPDGLCRPFDADAKGTVKGNGAGIVVIKRLVDALEHHDTIYAVIKGSATNNDGAAKVGYTASSIEGQVEVVSEAIARAEVDPESIRFIEAHGTGTILGDPIEVQALSEAFQAPASQKPYCAIGSVKANIGHLDIAAGVAGLIKSTLALHHRLLPRTINFESPNPNIDFDGSPFFANTDNLPLAEDDDSIHAGVSSFGIGGTNAHVILGSAPTMQTDPSNRSQQLIILSAKSESALESQLRNLSAYLQDRPDLPLADAAYTLQVGRNEYRHRAAFVANGDESLTDVLAEGGLALSSTVCDRDNAAVYFSFPGQGAQHSGMCADLYASEGLFRQEFDRCSKLFQQHLDLDLRDAVFSDGDARSINSTVISQPALFAVEYSLAKLWLALGIRPKGMIGHSIGEYVAACLAGVFTLDSAVKLISTRAKLMQSLPSGAMLMVHLSAQAVAPHVNERCSLAAVNGPGISVLSSDRETIEGLFDHFESREVACRMLQTSHAFHSWMLEPILPDFAAAFEGIQLSPPRIPYISNVSGDWIAADQATDPQYWLDHLRGTVQFADGLQTILQDKQAVLLEVGPNQVLTTLAKRSFGTSAVATSRHPQDRRNDVENWLKAVGSLWTEGVSVEWEALHGGAKRNRVALPTHPFNRESYWVGAGRCDGQSLETAGTPREQADDRLETESNAAPKTVPDHVNRMWREAFGLKSIRVSDNFFEIGGDSLLATQLIALIRQQLKVDVSITELFDAANFGEFVEVIQSRVGSGEHLPAGNGIVRVEPDFESRHRPFPLTDIQQAYWVGRSNAVELGDIATHIYLEVDIKDGDVARFQQAWNRLIGHHEMLRAIFLPSGEQEILKDVPEYQFEVISLEQMDASQAEQLRLDLRARMSHQVLPCDTWPLFDIKAAKVSDTKFRLCISIDILIVDAWSMNMLIEQWLQLYRDIDFPLRPLEFSFRDYVIAERGLRGTELYLKSEEYWFDRIDTLPGAPLLPLAQSPSAIKDVKFERIVYEMDIERWTKLKEKAIQQEITPTSLLICAFSEVLALWSQSPHFTLNLTNYSRHPFHDDAEYIVGDFTSLTLLEVNNDAGRSFAENAKQVQRQLWRDLDNRVVSAIHVLREMGKRRDGRVSMPIVFTSTLGGRVLEHENSADELGEEVFGVSQTSQVWLDHQVMEWQGRLKFNWDFVEALFPDGMIHSMFDVYCKYIERLVDDPEVWQSRPLNHLLPEPDAALIAAANNTDKSVALVPLQQSFVECALANPDSVAIIDGDTVLTYRQLYAYSQVIAEQLIQQGVAPTDIVGIYVERSWRQIAAVMGILVAGGAYLPLDVKLPEERLNFIIENSGMSCLVSADSQADAMPEKSEAMPFVNVDNIDSEALAAAAVQAPREALQTIDAPAYVLYTSGSTGQPKGAVLPHVGPANTIQDMSQIIELCASDRVIGLSALHFDLSVFDVFGTLSAGAALVIVPGPAELAPEQWHKLVNDHRVSVWNSVPTLVRIYVDYLSETGASVADQQLRSFVMSGDWIPPKLPARMAELWRGIKVLGAGGPTECSIWDACHWVVDEDTDKDSIPYGYPMANHQIHILNQQLQTCPIGVVGEMYVGGYGLALGYLGDQAKTDAVFIAHPETGQRLYKSGDLGRHTGIGTDGLEIIGRSDFQVKINGYRVELGEIEAAIRESSDFDDVVVVAQGGQNEDGKGKSRLVAYLLDKANDSKTSTEKSNNSPQGKLVAFKLSKPGIRRSLPTEVKVPLVTPHRDLRAYRRRKSYREYLGSGLDLGRFSQILGCLSEYRSDDLPMPKYRYPSSGSLHPVQLFLHVKLGSIEGLEGGFYYYQPERHELIRLVDQPELPKTYWGRGDNPHIFESAAFSLFLVGESNAIEPVYGAEGATTMMYLEAGYMSQLLQELASDQLVGLCPIGYFDKRLEKLLGLSPSQSVLHCMVGGSISEEQVRSWGTPANPKEASNDRPASREVLLKQKLAERLPSYMCPSAYIVLDQLPLTPNGKVDRQQLSSKAVVPGVVRPQLAPKNALERCIVEVWKEALGLDAVSTEDNFFEIGGDSVLILGVRQRLCSELDVDVSVVDLFKYPKIVELAGYLGDIAPSSNAPGVDEKSIDKQKAAIRRQRGRAKRVAG